MLAKFMCLTIDTTILHIDSVAQYRLVFDARVADMKRRRFGNPNYFKREVAIHLARFSHLTLLPFMIYARRLAAL